MMKRLLLLAICGLFIAGGASAQVNPANWYWQLTDFSGHAGAIFSSAGPGYVGTSDAGYLAWVAAGHTAAVLAKDGGLAQALGNSSLPSGATINAMILAVQPTNFSTVSGSIAARYGVVQAAISGGAVLTSTGTSSLNATYETSGAPWLLMQHELDCVNTAATFCDGTTTLTFIARSGTVSFATVAQFKAVMVGLLYYSSQWLVWLEAGGAVPTWGALTIP